MEALALALSRRTLEDRLADELGDRLDPARLRRPDAHRAIYEAWAPVGLLVHIAPGNAPAVGALSVVEGLLTGNLNVLKTASGCHRATVEILSALCRADPTGALADEPTDALDPATSESVLSTLLEQTLNRGTCLIMVTHDEEVSRTTHRRLELRGGRLHEKAS